MNATLSTFEYIQKLERIKKQEIDRCDWGKVRSLQLKIDNGLMIPEKRGKIGHYINESIQFEEKKPNRKERRELAKLKPKTAKAQIESEERNIVSKNQLDPRKAADDKFIKSVTSAAKDLYNFLKKTESGNVVKFSVTDEDVIVIYSLEKVDLPSVHRGFVVINKIKEKE